MGNVFSKVPTSVRKAIKANAKEFVWTDKEIKDKYFPPAFWKLPLVSLAIRDTPITSVPTQITQFKPTLRSLTISGNPAVQLLPTELVAFDRLEALIVPNNGLQVFPGWCVHMANLRKVDVSGNQLRTLPVDVIRVLIRDDIELCNLHDNPWDDPLLRAIRKDTPLHEVKSILKSILPKRNTQSAPTTDSATSPTIPTTDAKSPTPSATQKAATAAATPSTSQPTKSSPVEGTAANEPTTTVSATEAAEAGYAAATPEAVESTHGTGTENGPSNAEHEQAPHTASASNKDVSGAPSTDGAAAATSESNPDDGGEREPAPANGSHEAVGHTRESSSASRRGAARPVSLHGSLSQANMLAKAFVEMKTVRSKDELAADGSSPVTSPEAAVSPTYGTASDSPAPTASSSYRGGNLIPVLTAFAADKDARAKLRKVEPGSNRGSSASLNKLDAQENTFRVQLKKTGSKFALANGRDETGSKSNLANELRDDDDDADKKVENNKEGQREEIPAEEMKKEVTGREEPHAPETSSAEPAAAESPAAAENIQNTDTAGFEQHNGDEAAAATAAGAEDTPLDAQAEAAAVVEEVVQRAVTGIEHASDTGTLKDAPEQSAHASGEHDERTNEAESKAEEVVASS